MNARQVNQASPARLSVVAWPDPAVEGAGHRPGSAYVEAVWLGVLGPSATFAWCRLARLAAARPGTSVDTVDLAVGLGLGEGLGPNATISRTLGRLVAFGIAQRSGEIVAVRTALPDVSARQACRPPRPRAPGPRAPGPRRPSSPSERRTRACAGEHDERHGNCGPRRRGVAVRRPSPIEAARSRHPLAEVAARTGADPFRTSGSVTVRCPLPSHGHPDRTPSLRLHLDDGIFSCFGCGAKGDVVEWVRESEGVEWRDAIRILDQGRPLTNVWAGMAPADGGRPQPTQAPPTTRSGAVGETEAPDLARTPSERVYAVLDAAWGYYTYGPLHDRGLSHLAGRGIEGAVLEGRTGRAEVGHTPAKADGLVAALRCKGFGEDELVDAGLAHRRLGGGPVTDFYRQRVLIPVRDDRDRIAGFIGRNVGEQGHFAKYKNPPRTHAYDKSVNPYQPLPAPADRRGQVVVVEGTLDAMAIAVAAIRSGQAGRFCPVTQSGRELSRRS